MIELVQPKQIGEYAGFLVVGLLIRASEWVEPNAPEVFALKGSNMELALAVAAVSIRVVAIAYQAVSRTLPPFLSVLCVMPKPLLGILRYSKLKNIRMRCPARRRLVRRSKAKQI